MAESGRISPTEITIYSPSGCKITRKRSKSLSLVTLSPSPEEEQSYEESIASSDEVELNRIPDEYRLEETETPEHDSDVEPFQKMCDKPEIIVEVPPSYICTLKATPVSNEKKNEELSNMPEHIKKKGERFGTRDKSEMFKIEGDFNFDEEFKVKVKFDRDESDQYFDFFAVVKYDKTWFEIPAERKDDQVIFKTKKMEYFFITCSPKTKTMQLNSESDTIYHHESDSKIMVKFPKGSVEKNTSISITVFPVLREQLEKLKRDFKQPIIENISPLLIVSQPGKIEFNKPFRFTLPYKQLAPSKNSKTLMVRLDHDDQTAVVSEVETKDNDNAKHSCDVSNNMFSFVQTNQPVRDDKSSTNALRDEILYVVGESKRCILLTFINKQKKLIKTKKMEIEANKKVKETILTNGFRRLNQDSEVITLRKGQRIRAELRGGIQRQQARECFGLFIVFQPYLDTNYTEFTFDINKQMGAATHGEIRYCSDNFEKRVLHTLHFYPSRPFSNPFPIFRSRTMPILHENKSIHHQPVNNGGRGNPLTPRPKTEKVANRNPATTPRRKYLDL